MVVSPCDFINIKLFQLCNITDTLLLLPLPFYLSYAPEYPTLLRIVWERGGGGGGGGGGG